MNPTVCPLTWLLHKPLAFLFFFLLILHWVFISECGQESTQLSVPSSSLSSAQWWAFDSSSVRRQTRTQWEKSLATPYCTFKRLWNGLSVSELFKPDLLRHGCIFLQSRRCQILPVTRHCPPYLRSSRSHCRCCGGTNLERHMEKGTFSSLLFALTIHY